MFSETNNSCNDILNMECESGYSLYFPCIKTTTRGENVCFDFYIVDNAERQEVDLREVDDITLNIYGRYNCNLGSYSYPENIKSLQIEKYSEDLNDIDFSKIIINEVKLYIDIVDENHSLIESHLFNETIVLDIDIEGYIGYFLEGSNNNCILDLKGYDTDTYMFLGWNIEENDGVCDLENIYDFLINDRNLIYNVSEDLIIRAVYQKRREYTVQMDEDNFNSTFVVDYKGQSIKLINNSDYIKVLEGHDIKISCVPNSIMPYKFIKWEDGYDNPYRLLNVGGEEMNIMLKAQCELDDENKIFTDDIDVSELNNFKTIYPIIRDIIHIDDYYMDNIHINNCEVDVLNNIPYIKILSDGYIQMDNIYEVGNMKLTLNYFGGDCRLFIENREIPSSIVDKSEFLFEFAGETIILRGDNCCIFGFKICKEFIYDRGKCSLCLSSEETLKLQPGDLNIEGGVIVNGNPYGIQSVKFAKVTNIAPLIIKNNNI